MTARLYHRDPFGQLTPIRHVETYRVIDGVEFAYVRPASGNRAWVPTSELQTKEIAS